MSFTYFKAVESLFASKGVDVLFIKELSKRQDNEKNQIYLGNGQGINSIINLFPAKLSYGAASLSHKKKKSKQGNHKILAKLKYHWLFSDGSSFLAPNTKIINYFQYPEARLSGFLQSCKKSPDAIRRNKQSTFGKRILILGASNTDGITYGLLLTEADDPAVNSIPDFPPHASIPILKVCPVGTNSNITPKDKLFNELQTIAGTWHPSAILKNKETGPIPFKGNQGAGYTLEALLNITANSSKEPDKYGFEIKSFKAGGKISLMTPTADLGEEGILSFKDFMKKHGWLGKKGDGRIVFNGVFRFHKPNNNSGHYIDIEGFDQNSQEFSDILDSIVLCLINENIDEVISGWSFQKLLDSWSKKHMSACYVEYKKRPYSENGHDAEYCYTGRVLMCEQTTIFNYLKAIANNFVYYDPGHEIKSDGTQKVRPQWRITVTKKLTNSLEMLYDTIEEKSI